MLKRMTFVLASIMLICVQSGYAQDVIQNYLSDARAKVKAEDNPAQKRQILSESFETLSKALDRVQKSPMLSKDDRLDIDHIKADLQDRQDELAGVGGFERVPDGQLNAYADYAVQSMEQADQTINISLVAALLIVIIIILLA